MKRFPLMIVLTLALGVTHVALAASTGPTATELKEILHSPAALFVIAVLAYLFHGKKQTTVAARQGTARMTLIEYLSYWKETLGAFGLLVLGFGFLLATDQITDTAPLGLMFMAAVGLGIAPNSIVDLITKNGRSADLADAHSSNGDKK